MSELTARAWKALEEGVYRRCAEVRAPSPEARLVLQAVVRRLALGVAVPSQEVFAAELGFEERRLRSRLHELAECGFLYLAKRGSRPASYELEVERLRRWVAGEFQVDAVGQELPRYRDDNGTTNDPLWDENGAAASRARVNASSSSSSFSSASSSPQISDSSSGAASPAFEAMVSAARGYLKAAGVRMVYLNVLDLRRWLAKDTLQLADVEYACHQAAPHAPVTWAYIVAIFQEIEAKAEAEAAIIRGPWGREGTLG